MVCAKFRQTLVGTLRIAWRSTAPWDFIGAGFSNQVRSLAQGFKGSGIGPPTVEDAVGERTFLKIHVIHVGDFQFISRTGFRPSDLFESRSVVEINTSPGIIGLRIFGFFFNAKNPATREVRTAEALGIGNPLKKDMSAGRLLFKSLSRSDDIVLNDVVTQDDTDLFPFHKRFSKTQSVCDSAFPLLIGVMDSVQIEIFPVRKKP